MKLIVVLFGILFHANICHFYILRFNEVERGHTGFTTSVRLSVCLSVRPSVCTSVCGQNRVRSVYSTILAGSISYLHILSSNFRRSHVEVVVKFQSYNFWQIFGICNFGFVLLWHGIWYESTVWVIMGGKGVFSEHRRSGCSSCEWNAHAYVIHVLLGYRWGGQRLFWRQLYSELFAFVYIILMFIMTYSVVPL